jgi:hypothetical protein
VDRVALRRSDPHGSSSADRVRRADADHRASQSRRDRLEQLPWEDAGEYHALVAALVAEHAPQGPTEGHLVEELAGILWRKRRLRLNRSRWLIVAGWQMRWNLTARPSRQHWCIWTRPISRSG